MKRYQIHLTKTIDAEITIEADSERVARDYALSRPHSHFHWRDSGPQKITHVEEIAVFEVTDNPQE